MDLQNKRILFLGSSVTYGSAANGVSFADMIREECGADCLKEAVSGTTLVDLDSQSYVSRLKAVDPCFKPDLFVCQLSTNDAARRLPLPEIRQAIRFILEHVKSTYGCPAVFYTGTYYESPEYVSMIALLYELQKTYDFYILDMYHDPQMCSISKQDYARYMSDPIHPTYLGYKEWWTPKFVAFLEQIPLAN